jgi:hypothetical protein
MMLCWGSKSLPVLHHSYLSFHLSPNLFLILAAVPDEDGKGRGKSDPEAWESIKEAKP